MSEITTTLVGTRVRCDAFYGSAANDPALIGKFGTINSAHPDSDGDVQVTLDGGGIYYARRWTVLGEGDTVPGADLPADGATLPSTHWEEQLNSLIDAVYSGAKRNGYMSLLPDLFEEAGIPLRPVKREATIRGLRIVSPEFNATTGVSTALTNLRGGTTPEEVVVALNRVVADYRVTLPWPEQDTEGERPTCYDLNNALPENDFENVPDEVLVKVGLAVGYGSNPANVRRNLAKHAKAGSEYGISLSCDHC